MIKKEELSVKYELSDYYETLHFIVFLVRVLHISSFFISFLQRRKNVLSDMKKKPIESKQIESQNNEDKVSSWEKYMEILMSCILRKHQDDRKT